jgi:hypothetical protein
VLNVYLQGQEAYGNKSKILNHMAAVRASRSGNHGILYEVNKQINEVKKLKQEVETIRLPKHVSAEEVLLKEEQTTERIQAECLDNAENYLYSLGAFSSEEEEKLRDVNNKVAYVRGERQSLINESNQGDSGDSPWTNLSPSDFDGFNGGNDGGD